MVFLCFLRSRQPQLASKIGLGAVLSQLEANLRQLEANLRQLGATRRRSESNLTQHEANMSQHGDHNLGNWKLGNLEAWEPGGLGSLGTWDPGDPGGLGRLRGVWGPYDTKPPLGASRVFTS